MKRKIDPSWQPPVDVGKLVYQKFSFIGFGYQPFRYSDEILQEVECGHEYVALVLLGGLLVNAAIQRCHLQRAQFWKRLIELLDIPGMVVLHDGRKLPRLGRCDPSRHHNFHEPFEIERDDFVAAAHHCQTIQIEAEPMSKVQIDLTGPFEKVDEFGAVHFLVEDEVCAELRQVELKILSAVPRTGMYAHLFHHFTVELAVLDEQGHQHMERFDFFVLRDGLLVALG